MANAAAESVGSQTSLLDWVREDRRAMAMVAAFGASLMMNVINVVPWLGPVVEAMGDVGFEALALALAASILRRDGRPLKAFGLLAGLGALKIAANGLNLLPEIGSLLELFSELGIDVTQVWLLKEVVTKGGPRPPGA